MKTFHDRNRTIETSETLSVSRVVTKDKVKTPEGFPTTNQYWRAGMEYDKSKQRLKK